MTNHFAVRSSADWLYTNSHNAPPRDHYRVSVGPVFTFGGRAGVAKAAIGTTAATATTKNPAAFRPAVPIPALGIQVTTRDEGGTEIAEVASGGAAELANLHVGYVITSVDEKPVNTPMELTADLVARQVRRFVWDTCSIPAHSDFFRRRPLSFWRGPSNER